MQEKASAVAPTRNQLLAVMIDRWPAFYAWLGLEKGFETDPEPGKPQHCPVHGGESGRAFRYYPDMPVTGGGICNSCAEVRAPTGIDLLAGWLGAADELNKTEALTEALALIHEWLGERGLDIPPELAAQAVARWVGAYENKIAINYLQHRGLKAFTTKTLPASLRATTKLEWNKQTPAMLALIRLPDGSPGTCQVTNLELTKGGAYQKAANRHPARRTLTTGGLRSMTGSYVELGGDTGDVLLLGEGVETVLAGCQLYRACHPGEKFWARATLGKGNFVGQPVPAVVQRILLLADVDAIPAMRDVAGRLAHTHGLPCMVIEPPMEAGAKADWLDVLHDRGAEKALEAFREAEDRGEPLGDAVSALSEGERMPAPMSVPNVESVNLSLTQDSELFRLFSRRIAASPPSEWYCRSDGTAVLVRGIGLEDVRPEHAAAWLVKQFDWVTGTGFRVTVARTPTSIIRIWFQSSEGRRACQEALPVVRGVLARPALRECRPGQMWPCVFQTKSGYDKGASLLAVIDVKESDLFAEADEYLAQRISGARDGQPLGEEAVREARKIARQLWREVAREFFRDFRFGEGADAVGARAMLFSPIVSPLVSATPLFVVDAPQKESGKSTLAHAVANTWGGAFELGGKIDSEEELEKQFASAFLANHPLVLLDNVAHRVESPFLARLLTSPRTTRVRKLGGNITLTPPLGLVSFMTANAAELQEELLRRAVYVHLEAPDPTLAKRRQYRHHDLDTWTATNARLLRGKLYAIVRSWVLARCPAFTMARCVPETAPFPSFQDWADITLSILAWCNAGWPHPQSITQFLATRLKRLGEGDAETQELDRFFTYWHETFGNEWMTVQDLASAVVGNEDILSYVQAGNNSAAKTKRMGIVLSRLRNRRFPLAGALYTVEQEDEETRPDKNKHRARWRLVPARADGERSWPESADRDDGEESSGFKVSGSEDGGSIEAARRACEERGAALPFYIDESVDSAVTAPKESMPAASAADHGPSESSDAGSQDGQDGPACRREVKDPRA